MSLQKFPGGDMVDPDHTPFGLSRQLRLVLGFLAYIVVGWLILLLPVLHETDDASALDHFFTAASAVSTTGLTTVSTGGTYTFWGELVILLLFQIGAIAYMRLTTIIILSSGEEEEQRGRWLDDDKNEEADLKEKIRIKDLMRAVFYFTLIMEGGGVIALSFAFSAAGMPAQEAIWNGVFHGVSAFCTAGFALFDDSLQQFAGNETVSLIVAALAIAGSFGFLVVTDLWYRLSGRSESLSFTTRLILIGIPLLLVSGTALIYFTETGFGPATEDRLLKAFFTSMTATTTVGFNTIPIETLCLPVLLAVIFLMFVGASPAGTAGGLKITTLTVVLAILKSRLLGQEEVSAFGRRVPEDRLFVAISVFILYTGLILLSTFLMSVFEARPLRDLLFESASALGTVGLSTGITGDLTTGGKVVICLMMFLGRVGVLTFGFAVLKSQGGKQSAREEGDLVVGG